VVGSGINNNKIYIIDFGISKLFCDKFGKPLPLKTNKNFLGTTRYASIAAHEGNEQCQKDDLESLGYVLFFILKGSLPWQNLKFLEYEKNQKIAELKKDFVKN
jgi:casein kinase 1